MKKLPNIITIFGMAAVLLYAYASYICDVRLIIIGFVAAVLSDLVDGWIARKIGGVTPLGQWLDPIRDRMLLLAFFFQLYYWDYLSGQSLFLALVVITAEAGIWAIRLSAHRDTGILIKTNDVGKFREACHVLMMSAIIYDISIVQSRGSVTSGVVIMAAVSFAAFVSYAWEGRKLTGIVARRKAA